MYLFSPKRFKGSLSLTEQDMTLLQLICKFGFVNDTQLDILYSIVQHYPTRFFHPILLKWTQYSGLLQKRKKPLTTSSASVMHKVYIPTKSCRSFLNENGFDIGDDPLVAVNSHNEQAIEIVVQSLYTAMFKASNYVPYSAYLSSNTSYRLLGNPDISLRTIRIRDSNNTNQKNQIYLDPEGFTVPDSLIQKNQIWNPEKAPRKSKSAASPSVPTIDLKKHFSFIRGLSTTAIDKYVSILTTCIYDSLLDGGINDKELSLIDKYYPLLVSIDNKDSSSNASKADILSSNYLRKNSRPTDSKAFAKSEGAKSDREESSFLNDSSEFNLSGSAINGDENLKESSTSSDVLNTSSEPENKLSERDAYQHNASSNASKKSNDRRFINERQAELDQLLAEASGENKLVTPTDGSLVKKDKSHGEKQDLVTPTDGSLAKKANKKGCAYHLAGLRNPIKISNTDLLKKKPIYSAGSALINLKLLSIVLNSENQPHAFRYPTAHPDNLTRNINLISNPTFEPALLDTSSFKNQYKYQQYTFVADEVVSFNRNGRRQEIFVEQDNRTESNSTQIQKILNYISYALEHPQRDILLMISITDGSLASPKVPKYMNIGRKLASLASKFLKSYLRDKNGEKVFLSQMYKQATNLKIVLSGVSESQIDLAQFLLGSNYSMDYYQTIKKYVTKINKESQWNATFEPSKEFSAILGDPELATQPLNKLSNFNENSPAKGLWRYTDTIFASPRLGTIHYRNKLSRQRYTQPIIAGDEHSLDTVIQTLELVTQANRVKDTCPPVIVYPHRERPVTAISLNQYRDLYNWLPTWRPTIPVMIQPLTGLKDNLQLHKELRWLTIQYDLDIYNYFKIGAINKFALKKNPNYGDEYITPLKWSINTKARNYDELHKLALKMSKKEFVDQLRLNEIPLGLFRTVLERWPKGIYDLPLIDKLPYIEFDQDQPTILEEESIFNHLYAPNSVIPSSRIKLHFHNEEQLHLSSM